MSTLRQPHCPAASSSRRLHGQIIAAHGRNYLVEIRTEQHTWQRLVCYTRGRKNDLAVGDWVQVLASTADQGVIEQIEARHSLLYRSDAFKTKLFAANVQQIGVVVATFPSFAPDLIQRAVLAAQVAGIACTVLLNKIDQLAHLASARAQLAQQGLTELGVAIIELSALDQGATVAQLRPWLAQKTTLLMGQSGMGKSSILNALIPDVSARTQSISAALGSGKHTTTVTQLYRLPRLVEDDAPETSLIDSPGFQAFGLAHIGAHELAQAMQEFIPHLGHCRFYNCTHQAEPHCAVRQALMAGKINPARYALYCTLLHEHAYAVQQRQGW